MTHIDEHKLWEYIMGDLDNETANQVKGHLKTCPNCQKQYSIQLQFHKELLEMEDDIPKSGFSQKVIQHIERDLRLDRRLEFWLGFGKIAVISALTIAIGLSLFMLRSQNISISIDAQLASKISLQLLSGCAILWLLYVLDVALKRFRHRS